LEKKKKKKLITNIKVFLSEDTKKKYSELGVRYKQNYLFAGYPGTGKSSLAYAIASSLEMGIAIIHFGPTLSDVMLAKALKTIPLNTILLLEDIDSLFTTDRKASDFKNMVSFSGLLNCLDGIFYKEGLITIMTTNFKSRLDGALQRPGRVDFVMDFGYSTEKEIQMMYDTFYPEKKDEFRLFYKKIQHVHLTMASVQVYFLEHMNGEQLIEDIDILKKRAEELKYDEHNMSLYS
jgi:chaperone BCS1